MGPNFKTFGLSDLGWGLSNKLPSVDVLMVIWGPHFEKNYIKAIEILWNISIIFKVKDCNIFS